MSSGRIVDAGNGLVSASLTSTGAWLSLGAAHSRHGFVELTGLPPFDPAWRGDPAAVRRYRDRMTCERFGFLELELGPAGSHEIATRASATGPWIEQRHRIAGLAGQAVLRFHGRLDAHPLPEITDIDPPAPTGAQTRLRANGGRLLVDAAALPARAEVSVAVEGGADSGWAIAGAGAELIVVPAGGAELELVVACSLAEQAGARSTVAVRPSARPRAGLDGALHVPRSMRAPLAALAERTRSYVLGCTAVRVADDEVCLLTDHRILPLSWTRDAYWQAAMLLAGDPDDAAIETVEAHLRWLWRRCDRPQRFWMRSHHTNGAIKGGFKWSLQRLDGEVLRWRGRDGGVGLIGRGGRRCVRLVALRWRGARIASGSGRRSPTGSRASRPAWLPACRPRSASGGSVTVAACRRSAGRRCRDATCRLSSARRSRS